MVTTARRHQPPITIRSERARARLELLTKGGRSQAEVIEEALDRMPLPGTALTREEKIALINSTVAKARGLPHTTIDAFDAQEYDENGMPQ
jgi:antitoxin VapB